ncbi:helix-turn-helix domain-containing protein [uncultured Tateyamaria sp.]|uniref:winged helix-turn-helix transcriptional regulator n=1 Tax=uncultured Tateyamaria sp. TaxID=455651 RepID=UPI0026090E97|nr:helix-turn-helix domain-containing protein [uncultured Tateyamaria sp.]
MILRDLFRDGTCKFQDFDAQKRGFSPNTVSARLKSLVDRGFVQTVLYQDHPPRYHYSLTKAGHALGPVMTAMYDWAGGTSDYTPPSQRSLT